MRQRTVIHWGMSSYFGWGVYGLNLALAWAEDPDIEPLCSRPFDPDEIVVDPARRRALEPVLAASQAFQAALKARAGAQVSVAMPMLAGVTPDFEMIRAVHDVALTGQPTMAVAFFETARLSPEIAARAAAFPRVVVGSTWNAHALRDHGVETVTTVLQGVDPSLFHPAARASAPDGRFRVFSGGKLERRKGQDIVMAAFRRFAERHPDALLVTAWHSPWPAGARGLDISGIAAPVVFNPQGPVDLPAWAAANGLAADQVLDLGPIPNAALPQVLRDMDVAVFPNRCEGGTNLAAMECMACGVPTILSRNTGHLDLIEEGNCYALSRQGEVVDGGPGTRDIAGWGESDVEEALAALEQAYADRDDARRRGALGARTLRAMPWSRTADAMKALVLSLA
ncbi:MAG: glycosyltransferase family 4 protein [Phenylobacterium sp.]